MIIKTPVGYRYPDQFVLSTCSLSESRRRDDTADADAAVAHPRRQPSTYGTAMGTPRRRSPRREMTMEAHDQAVPTLTEETTEATTLTEETTEVMTTRRRP